MDLKGKVALITGGTGGIGRAAAVAFARRGAAVVVTGRREAEGNETVKLVEREGARGLFVRADTAVEADVARSVQETVRAFGGLHYAFNNAGVEGLAGVPTTDQTIENYRHVFDINVLGVLLSMKHEIPAIVKSGGGAIVNNASIGGTIGMPGFPVYIASKHAVIGL
ncbi:MAG: SDR family NAD(P)-dependent oxidoreductase, partial [Planctomycetota bacterium]|nr:SDR family NAD(P)-dependent oxidoreductase [Planctomycetota bacterium]